MWYFKRFTRTPRAHREPARRRLFIEGLEDRCLPASGLSATLVADIVPGAVGSNPSALLPVNGTQFFVADDGIHGPELYKSDGTAAGTVLVKDINPGSGGTNLGNLTKVGGTLFFTADDGVHGTELWKSDGTAAGTVLVEDIHPGSSGSSPGNLTDAKGSLFFSAHDSVHGFELWKSDGTAAGTVLVKDIVPGITGSDFSSLTNLDGTIFFRAWSNERYGLWKSEGTAAGTVLVKDRIYPQGMAAINGLLFFNMGNRELWTSDGTKGGTGRLKSIELVGGFTEAGGTVYFSGAGAEGRELWKTDGTPAGTVLVKDIFTGSFASCTGGGWDILPGADRGSGAKPKCVAIPYGSFPSQLTNVNGRLYFTAYTGNGNTGWELWTSDGTAAGTVLVKDINTGGSSSGPLQLTNVNGLLYFTADDGNHGRELWQSDGTAAGTVMVQDINPGSASSDPTYLVGMNNTLYFSADDGTHGRELWDPPPVELPTGNGVDVVSADPNDWPMFGHDPQGTRYNRAEHRLGPRTVGDLQIKWTFDTAGAITGTPVVVNNNVYAGDMTGTVYALTRDGELLWQTTLNVPSVFNLKINASPLVTNRTVVIGDMAGQIHGLDAETGQVRWTTRPPNPGPIFGDQHPFQMIMGAGTMVGNYVAFGVSSLENAFGPLADPNYPGFTFRGNVVLIDPADGRIVWQTFFVDEATLQPDGSFGPSGATVWGSPAYDQASKTFFVGTGQHYGPPTTDTSDPLIALDAATGAIKWVSQMTPDDTWNITFGPPSDNDLDIGDSPQLYLLNGRLVVAAGQKSGFFHVVDADTGEAITPPQQYLPPGGLGGFHIDSAVANGVNYAPGN